MSSVYCPTQKAQSLLDVKSLATDIAIELYPQKKVLKVNKSCALLYCLVLEILRQ